MGKPRKEPRKMEWEVKGRNSNRTDHGEDILMLEWIKTYAKEFKQHEVEIVD